MIHPEQTSQTFESRYIQLLYRVNACRCISVSITPFTSRGVGWGQQQQWYGIRWSCPCGWSCTAALWVHNFYVSNINITLQFGNLFWIIQYSFGSEKTPPILPDRRYGAIVGDDDNKMEGMHAFHSKIDGDSQCTAVHHASASF